MRSDRRGSGLPLLALAAGLVAPLPLSAQEPQEPLRPGDRLRVYSRVDSERRTGSLVSLDTERLVLLVRGAHHNLAIDDISRLERRLGRTNHAGRGALIGGGVGFATGAVLSIILVNGLCDAATGCGDDVVEAVVVVGGLGAIVGAGIGALIGLAASHDDWEPVPRSALTPVGTRVRLGVWTTADGTTFFGLRIGGT